MSEFESQMTGDAYDEGYWEHGVGSNYRSYGNDPGWESLVMAVRAFEPPGRWLDVAAAKGWLVWTADQLGYDAWGIDISPWAVQNGAPLEVGQLIEGNAANLPWVADSFDVVTSMEFLEHVPETEIDRVIDEMIRVCRSGGLMLHKIGLDLEGSHDWDRFGTDATGQQHDATHVLEMPKWWWIQKFDAMPLTRQTDVELVLDEMFHDRDWWGRFVAYRVD